MRRVWFAIAILAGSILIGGLWFVPGLVGAHTGGGGMMGPGMMGYGHGFFDECAKMMSRYGYRQYPGSPESQKLETRKALTQEDAVSIVQNYLDHTTNPNLKVGEVENEEDGDYLVEIVTKDGSLVDKLEVNRLTGWIHSIYGE
jgi:hypothetical protein